MESSEYSIFRPQGSNFEEIKYELPLEETKAVHDYVRYSLIVPAYNEEKRIRPFLEHLREIISNDWEVIIVCDGTDNTASIARKFGSIFQVLEFGRRLGKGGAVLEGFRHANGDIIGYVDADGALSVDEIRRIFGMVGPLQPVVIASRWINGSKIEIKQSLTRLVMGRLYHYATFAILGIKQKDIQCGLKAFNRNALFNIMGRLQLSNMSLDTAILYHCKLLGYPISEAPVHWKDVKGSKFTPIKTAMAMFFTLVGLRLAHSTKSMRFRKALLEIHDFFNSF